MRTIEIAEQELVTANEALKVSSAELVKKVGEAQNALNSNAALIKERDDLKATNDKLVANHAAALKESAEALAKITAERDQLKVADQNLDRLAALKAAKICAEAGVDALRVTSGTGVAASEPLTLKAFRELTPFAKQEFLSKGGKLIE